jgi:NADP-dependent 3-hydroxy acid dehydrogenase YdfG
MTSPVKTWLITGCSSGLGRFLADAALSVGHRVVVTARDTSRLSEFEDRYRDSAMTLSLDVNDHSSIDRAVSAAQDRFGAIEVLVNNAGYSYRSAIEEGEDPEVAALFQTNFFGPLSLIRAVLPNMRVRRCGTIVNISSVRGQVSVAGSGFYSATKFALEGLSEALLQELSHLGIRVMLVEPGAFRTDFSGRSLRGTKRSIPDYEIPVGPRRKENERGHGLQQGDPAKGARVIVETVSGDVLPTRLLLGSDAVRMVKDALLLRLAEIERWEPLSKSTDFDAL